MQVSCVLFVGMTLVIDGALLRQKVTERGAVTSSSRRFNTRLSSSHVGGEKEGGKSPPPYNPDGEPRIFQPNGKVSPRIPYGTPQLPEPRDPSSTQLLDGRSDPPAQDVQYSTPRNADGKSSGPPQPTGPTLPINSAESVRPSLLNVENLQLRLSDVIIRPIAFFPPGPLGPAGGIVPQKISCTDDEHRCGNIPIPVPKRVTG